MTRKRKLVATTILFSQYLLFTLNGAYSQEVSDSLDATISLEKKIITQHEPAILDIKLDNPSQQSIDLNLGYDYEKLDIKVVDPAGKTFRKPRPVAQEGMQFSDAVHLQPRTDSVRSVALNDWFHFDKVGTYQIDIVFSFPDYRNTNTTLALTVLPRDEMSLGTACASLLARLQNSPSYTESLTAAKALSEVDDPSAVPFLESAMQRKEFTAIMITALAHLKTPNAIRVLISASQSRDSEMSSLAHAALLSLGKTENH